MVSDRRRKGHNCFGSLKQGDVFQETLLPVHEKFGKLLKDLRFDFTTGIVLSAGMPVYASMVRLENA